MESLRVSAPPTAAGGAARRRRREREQRAAHAAEVRDRATAAIAEIDARTAAHQRPLSLLQKQRP